VIATNAMRFETYAGYSWYYGCELQLLRDGAPLSEARLAAVEYEDLYGCLVVSKVSPPEITWLQRLGFFDGVSPPTYGFATTDVPTTGERLLLTGYVEEMPGVYYLDVDRRSYTWAGRDGGLSNDDFGWRVVEVGDFDGDAARDFATSCASRDAAAPHIQLVNHGLDTVLARHPLPVPGLRACSLSELRGAGDRSSFAVAFLATSDNFGLYPSHLGVWWPKGEHANWLIEVAPTAGCFWRTDLVVIADVDGDGVCDLVIGGDARAVRGLRGDRISCISGRTGSVIWASQLPGETGACVELCLVDDRDGDGLREVLVARPGDVTANALSVLAARDGRLIGVIEPPPDVTASFGRALDGASYRLDSGELRSFVAVGEPRQPGGVVWLLELEPPQR
jgi:hypothetical protein